MGALRGVAMTKGNFISGRDKMKNRPWIGHDSQDPSYQLRWNLRR
jgi:hypothetical protein